MMIKSVFLLFGLCQAKGILGEMKSLLDSEPGKSRSRHTTWHAESESTLNDHIALEMAAAIQYRAMYAYAARDYVNLKKSAEFFAHNADEEFSHAYELMEYQVKRGGAVEIKALEAPVHEFAATIDKSDALVVFESALALEKRVYDSLLAVHNVCTKHGDPQCEDFIESYLDDQIKAIDLLARYVADLYRVGLSGHAVWHWDQELSE